MEQLKYSLRAELQNNNAELFELLTEDGNRNAELDELFELATEEMEDHIF